MANLILELWRAREVAQQLGAGAALPEDMSLVCSTDMKLTAMCNPVTGVQGTLLVSRGTKYPCDKQTYMPTKQLYTSNSNSKEFFKTKETKSKNFNIKWGSM